MAYLKLAHESYIKMTDDYYGSQVGLGMWEIPKNFDEFNEEFRFILLDEISDENRKKREKVTEMRTDNRRESVHNAAVDTAQEVRTIARQLGMLSVDAALDTVRQKGPGHQRAQRVQGASVVGD